MFGLGLPFLSYFRRQVGLRGEAADAAGSLHAKTALLGNPNPTTPDETKVMNFLLKLKYMSGIVYASSTLRKAISTGVITCSPTDYYEGRYRQSGVATITSFMAGVTGRIRVQIDIKNNEVYTSYANSSERYDKQAQYGPGMYLYVNGSNTFSGRIPIQRNYNWTTITGDTNVKVGDVVSVQIFSGYYYYTSCGNTYNYFNGAQGQNARIYFDYDDTGILPL